MSSSQNLVNKLTGNPRLLFIADGTGALLSTFLLGVILVRFESFFGMPKEALYILAAIPCIFILYDLLCYTLVKTNHSFYIKGIAFANPSYCVLSAGFLFHHHQSLSIFGWLYFVSEILLVVAIAGIELQSAKQLVA